MANNQNNTDTGYLIIQVSTAGMGLPVEGAHVTVSRESENGNYVERVLVTDRNGRSEKIELAAPPRSNSMVPSDLEDYSKYTVQTEKEGYYPVENLEVPIFGGQTTLQQVSLIPLPLGYQMQPQPQIITDTEPTDL